MRNIRPGTSVRKCVILCIGEKKQQVHPSGVSTLRRISGVAMRCCLSASSSLFVWGGSRPDSFSLSKWWSTDPAPNEVPSVVHSLEEGRGERRGEPQSAVRVIQPLSQSVHTSTQTLNFLPFPSPESLWSMLSEALQGCLVTTVHPDAFSLLGWTPYKKGEPVWIVMSESEEDRGDCSGDLKVLFVSKVEFWVSFPTRFGM